MITESARGLAHSKNSRSFAGCLGKRTFAVGRVSRGSDLECGGSTPLWLSAESASERRTTAASTRGQRGTGLQPVRASEARRRARRGVFPSALCPGGAHVKVVLAREEVPVVTRQFWNPCRGSGRLERRPSLRSAPYRRLRPSCLHGLKTRATLAARVCDDASIFHAARAERESGVKPSPKPRGTHSRLAKAVPLCSARRFTFLRTPAALLSTP
jgi:hypothetical protein